MGGQRWKVVQEVPGAGVPVRQSADEHAKSLDSLPGGAVIEEQELVGDMLRFKRISGVGPMTGWVALTGSTRKLLYRVVKPSSHPNPQAVGQKTKESLAKAGVGELGTGRRWHVIAGDVNGLRVREGQSLNSAELAERLPIGACVEELELLGNRMRFVNASKAGPKSGWVSLQACGRDMLVPESSLQVKEAVKLPDFPDVNVDDDPLGGWAKLAQNYSNLPQLVAVAAETGSTVRDLPPLEQLETATEEMLMQKWGFPPDAAFEFYRMTAKRKKKIIAESRALIEMSQEERQEALLKLQKAWPNGPMPEFTDVDGGPDLLPPGYCFPLSRNADAAADGNVDQARVKIAEARKGYKSAAEQRDFLRSLKCNVACTGAPQSPEPSATIVDPCKIENMNISKDQLASAIVAKGSLRPDDVAAYLNRELRSRAILLDGDAGARFAMARMSEDDYRGDRFKASREVDASGQAVAFKLHHDVLSLSKPQLVSNMHREFLAAGSDIIRTNTRESNIISLEKLRIAHLAYELNRESAQLAKKAAAEVTKQNKGKPRFVAGVLAPLSAEGLQWSAMVAAYEEQVRGLADGGVDLLAIDAFEDALAAKAAVFAVQAFFERTSTKQLPLLISACVDGKTDRVRGGGSVAAFCISVKHAGALATGFSCLSAPLHAADAHRSLSQPSQNWSNVCCGADGLEPDQFAASLVELSKSSPVNIVGGSANVLPSHIASLAQRASELRLRALPAASSTLQLAGTEAVFVSTDAGCQLIGQQCSSIGSKRFAKAMDAYKSTRDEGALRRAAEMCRKQFDNHADIVDINLDTDVPGGIPVAGKSIMGKFVQQCCQDEKIAKSPMMICSCDWGTIKEGLQSTPGRGIVNGICLMLGEEEFLRLARECQRLGAALVVLAISETGLAESREEKIKVCQRSYRLLRSKLDFPAEDIIFDCQVLHLGLPESAACAVNFLEAVAELKRTCPGASFIAGVNNISYNFRGLHHLRDALHSVFLYHATQRGVNLALLEPGALPLYQDLDHQTRQICEDLVLNRSANGDHLERFLALANFQSQQSTCLPVSRDSLVGGIYQNEQTGPTSEGRETQSNILKKRKRATPSEQKTYWQSKSCFVACSGGAVPADPDATQKEPCDMSGACDKPLLMETVMKRAAVPPDTLVRYLNTELLRRVCVFDGIPTNRLANRKLAEADYRGARFKNSQIDLAGNYSLLCLSRPELVTELHKESFTNGADVCFTNTLEANDLSQERFNSTELVYEMNKVAAELAKAAAAEAAALDKNRPRFVAGVLGPARRDEPGQLEATWDELVEAYTDQVRGLLDGGIDMFVVAMVQSASSAKAAISAISEHCDRTGRERPPVVVSVQVDAAGKLPTGQTLPAFLLSVKHARTFAVGICGPHVTASTCQMLSEHCRGWAFALADDDCKGRLTSCCSQRLVNIVGGGRTGSDLKAVAACAQTATTRPLPKSPAKSSLTLCNLEVADLGGDGKVRLVGQRCNANGSLSFKNLVLAYKYAPKGSQWEAAINVCVEQVKAGADILDINFDTDVIDSKWAMGKFVHLCSSDQRLAKVPLMLSSHTWPVIEEGLRNAQGKCIVNAISIVQGEEDFLMLARACKRHGAAVVVMAIDPSGESMSVESIVSNCTQCYRLLRKKVDFPAEDIVFDCSLKPIGTYDSDAASASTFIQAVAELKRTCPGVSFIGGLSNISLGFRGIQPLREALHSAFLEKAIPSGLNLVIAEPGHLPPFSGLEEPAANICMDVVSNSSVDMEHVARMSKYAAFLRGDPEEQSSDQIVAVSEDSLPLAALPAPIKPSASYRKPLETLVQTTGMTNGSLFMMFGCKAHAANNFHRLSMTSNLKRSVLFSSISAYMGQGGAGPMPGASSFLDGCALWERHQGINDQVISVQWGAIGDIGLRLAIYGSRDVFAHADLGQKLISPEDTQDLEHQLMTGYGVAEFIGLAYLDESWTNTLMGKSAGAFVQRSTFADM